jgi:predicted metal-binding membrane protein
VTAGASPASVGGRPLGAAPSARGDSALAAVRARLGLVGLLFVVAGVAWWSTASRMAGMDGGPGTDLGSLPWFLGVWVVMMAAMMFPSVSPTVALYARMTRRRGPSRPLLFAAAYLVVWGAAGVVAYGVFELGVWLVGERLSWDGGGRWLAGGVLAIAAVYELTPLKNVCLAKCRSPLGFLLGSWRDGSRGAMFMGGRHAAWCLGCCWALMAAMFALGVMSLQWMAVVAGLIALEKTLPWRRAVVWGTTLVLLGLAAAVIVAPSSVPGLVVPSGMHGGGGMGAMP